MIDSLCITSLYATALVSICLSAYSSPPPSSPIYDDGDDDGDYDDDERDDFIQSRP